MLVSHVMCQLKGCVDVNASAVVVGYAEERAVLCFVLISF